MNGRCLCYTVRMRFADVFTSSKKPVQPAEQWFVLSDPDAAADSDNWPRSLQYVIAIKPARQATLADLLQRGCGLGVCEKTGVSDEARQGVEKLATLTQEGVLHPWLERLLVRGEVPLWSATDAQDAQERGVDLNQAVDAIKQHHREAKRFALVRPADGNPQDDDVKFIEELNVELASLHAAETARRLSVAVQPKQDALTLSIWISILVVGPLSHVCEMLLPGLGKVIAALGQSAFVEGRSARRAQQNGSAWWQVRRKLMPIVPYAALGIVLAIVCQLLVRSGSFVLAGLFFGLAAVAVPGARFFMRIGDVNRRYENLWRMGKLPANMTFRWYEGHDGNMRLIRLVSLCLSPIVSFLVFVSLPSLTSNGWLLALLGLFPWLATEFLGWAWERYEQWKQDHAVRKMLKQILTSP